MLGLGWAAVCDAVPILNQHVIMRGFTFFRD